MTRTAYIISILLILTSATLAQDDAYYIIIIGFGAASLILSKCAKVIIADEKKDAKIDTSQ